MSFHSPGVHAWVCVVTSFSPVHRACLSFVHFFASLWAGLTDKANESPVNGATLSIPFNDPGVNAWATEKPSLSILIRAFVQTQSVCLSKFSRVVLSRPLACGFRGELRQITLRNANRFETARQAADLNETIEPCSQGVAGLTFITGVRSSAVRSPAFRRKFVAG